MSKKKLILLLHSLNKNAFDDISKKLESGKIIRKIDKEMKCPIIELTGANVDCNFICIPSRQNYKISESEKMKYLNMTIKNLNKKFSFKVFLIIDQNEKIIEFCNFEKKTRIFKNHAIIPLKLIDGWNYLNICFFEISCKIFNFEEKVIFKKIQISANCGIKKIFLTKDYFIDGQFKVKEYIDNIFHSELI